MSEEQINEVAAEVEAAELDEIVEQQAAESPEVETQASFLTIVTEVSDSLRVNFEPVDPEDHLPRWALEGLLLTVWEIIQGRGDVDTEFVDEDEITDA